MTTPLHRELRSDGEQQGRDPRTLTPGELGSMGLTRESRGDAIRAKCLDCCAGNSAEIRRCAAKDCSLWPFRMGTDPWREKRVLSDSQRATLDAHRPRPQFYALNQPGNAD